MDTFVEITLVVSAASVFALILYLFRQPLIIAYILAGIVLGPVGFDVVKSQETLQIFSQLGITTLLFIIGLHLNPKIIKEVGGVSLITGVGQIAFTSAIGFLLTKLFGFSLVESIFIAIALTFSSTIIVLKLLNDKGDLDKLYGKISVGFLLVQDLAACLILLFVSLLTQTTEANLGVTFGILGLKVISLSLAIIAVSIYVLPKVLKLAAHSQELLFLFSISWGMLLAAGFYLSGLSIEVGALIAGVSLSATSYATEMSAKLRPLRDFFIVTFFILLGSHLIFENLLTILIPALALSIFVLIGNPLIVFYIMNLLGYKNRTAFLAGLTVAQISEFSMILIALGFQNNLIDQTVVSLVTLVGIVTIAASSYMIIYANQLYGLISPLLAAISIKKSNNSQSAVPSKKYQAILFGYGRVGSDYLRTFQKLNLETLVIDYNPEVIGRIENSSIDSVYGDAEDAELLNDIPFHQAQIVVSSLNDFEADCLIIKSALTNNREITVIVKTNDLRTANRLYKLGATYVVMPHYIGAHYAARLIKRNGTKPNAYKKDRIDHLHFLKQRIN